MKSESCRHLERSSLENHGTDVVTIYDFTRAVDGTSDRIALKREPTRDNAEKFNAEKLIPSLLSF